MIYVGLDVHQRFSRVGVFDPASGDLEDLGTVSNGPSALRGVLSGVPSPKTVVLETGRSSYYMASLLDAMAEQVWIVDAREVRRLQRTISKTDRRDAAALAWWAAKGVLTPQWRPDAELLDLRELTRGKMTLTQLSIQIRTMIRSLLARHGYECPYRNLLGKSAQQWLNGVKLEGYAAHMFAALRQILVTTQAKVADFERLVDQAAAGHPAAQRLRSIPGIGSFLSLSLAAEIGDINRFPSATHLRGYSGLAPAVHQSGDKDARGPLTKTGNKWLRYAAVQGAQRMSQMRHPDPRMKRIFLSVSFRHGCNPGKIAAARRLLDMIYHLLTQKQDYQAPATATAVRQA